MSEPVRNPDELERLRAELAALKAERDALAAQVNALRYPTSIMVRIDDGWITPSDAVREITRLRAEIAALKAHDPLNDAVEEACGELPDGWQVIINMERGAGWVDLFDPDGDCIEVHEDETSVANLVREAVRRAKGVQS